MLPLGRNKGPGWIKHGGGPDSACRTVLPVLESEIKEWLPRAMGMESDS